MNRLTVVGLTPKSDRPYGSMASECYLCEQIVNEVRAATERHAALVGELIDGKSLGNEWYMQQRSKVESARTAAKLAREALVTHKSEHLSQINRN